MTYQWGNQQDRALKQVSHWLKNPNGQQVFRLFGVAGTGKSQPVDCEVQTPEGRKAIGSLRAGDLVFGRDGKPTQVLGVYPQGKLKTYRVRFRDGSSTRCSGEHLWGIIDSHGKYRVLTLDKILSIGVRNVKCKVYNYQIPLCSPVEYKAKELPIPPYALGALIGDGYLKDGTVISIPEHKREILERLKSLLPEYGTSKRDNGQNCPQYNFTLNGPGTPHPLNKAIRDLGLNVNSGQRFIPEIYLTSSVEDRIELLRGIMDTDGTARGNRIGLSTTSPMLLRDVKRLVQSLGGTAIEGKPTPCSTGVMELVLNVKVFTFNPFRLSYKANDWKPSTKNPPSRYIVSVDEEGEDEHVCIQVEAEDQLYLTDEFIVTHNTTLAKHLAESVNKTVFAAFTGKAASIMRSSGCYGAQTIHSLIYKPLGQSHDKLKEIKEELDQIDAQLTDSTLPQNRRDHLVRRRDMLMGAFTNEKRKANNLEFLLKTDSDLKSADLLVLDECSMVPTDMAMDLLSFNKPILVLGDPAQLPPVFGEGYFTDAKPDVMLTEIHRQARDNPIIDLATRVREGRTLEYGSYGNSKIVRRGDPDDILAASQVLVGRNVTRTNTNRYYRRLKGWSDSPYPVEGEKLVCLRNDKEVGLLNGTLHVTTQDALLAEEDFLILRMRAEDEEQMRDLVVQAHPQHFNGNPDDISPWERMLAQEFTYGYALTVHKAQGSGWKDVLLVDEWFQRDSRQRWLYTGITRAKERIVIVRNEG